MVERYWDERPSRGVLLSAQFLADSLANERRALEAAAAVNRSDLDADSRLTYDIFVRRRQIRVEGYTYPAELVPIDPFDSLPFELAREAAKAGEGQLTSARDYDAWLQRLDEGAAWMHQALANLREGVRRGYTVPRVLVERAIPLLEQLGEDTSTNVFYSAAHTIPDTIQDPDHAALAGRLGAAVKERVLPAYRELHDYLKGEYLPKARTTVALAALPLGAAWYANRIARVTGVRLDPMQLHALGLAEVEKIHARIQALPPPGMPAAGSDPIVAAEELKAKVSAAVTTSFAALPPTDFVIRAFTPRYDEPTMSYQPAAPPARPTAVLFVAAGSTEGRVEPIEVPQFLEAAIPGRHFQAAFQLAGAGLPSFRRMESELAFVEGWALYAATLGDELQLYDDDARRQLLGRELRCAARLVIDTGLQAKGWTPGQALEYLKAQASMEDLEARAAVDRAIALPADGIACTVGETRIRSLRSAALAALGAKFDVKEFHARLLDAGSMPLDLLDARMLAWVESAR